MWVHVGAGGMLVSLGDSASACKGACVGAVRRAAGAAPPSAGCGSCLAYAQTAGAEAMGAEGGHPVAACKHYTNQRVCMPELGIAHNAGGCVVCSAACHAMQRVIGLPAHR